MNLSSSTRRPFALLSIAVLLLLGFGVVGAVRGQERVPSSAPFQNPPLPSETETDLPQPPSVLSLPLALPPAVSEPSPSAVLSGSPNGTGSPENAHQQRLRGREMRGMWVVRDDMHTREQVRQMVRLAKKYRFNTLFVQVRGRGDAYYASNLEPRAEELAGENLDFDALAAIVDEGHRAGLQVHAWMNVFLVWHRTRRPYSALHVANRRPDWLVRDRQNRVLWGTRSDAEGAFLNPTFAGARQHLRDVFTDVAARYDVDGIHLDYVRFPNNEFSFGDADLAEFRSQLLPRAPAHLATYADARARLGSRCAWAYVFAKEWRAWRRGLVTQTVREIAAGVRAVRPRAALTAAVFPNYGVASGDKGQAWHEWLREGLVDGVALMAYNTSTSVVADQVRDAVRHSAGRMVFAGLGAWRMPAQSAIVKAKIARALGAHGVVFFSYGNITRSGKSGTYLAKLCGALFSKNAKSPDWRPLVETAWLSIP